MEFIQILQWNILITVFLVLGVRTVTDEGKIFYKVRVAVIGTLGPFWSKPIVSCAPCMSSFWSIWPTLLMIVMFSEMIPGIFFIILLPLTALCAAFPSALFWAFYTNQTK